MHVAHSSINAVGLPFADLGAEERSRLLVVARVEDVFAPLVLTRVLLAGRLATCGPLELPHAAKPTAARATSAASPGPPDRGRGS
jgi:predicted small lipoprotein YifL